MAALRRRNGWLATGDADAVSLVEGSLEATAGALPERRVGAAGAGCGSAEGSDRPAAATMLGPSTVSAAAAAGADDRADGDVRETGACGVGSAAASARRGWATATSAAAGAASAATAARTGTASASGCDCRGAVAAAASVALSAAARAAAPRGVSIWVAGAWASRAGRCGCTVRWPATGASVDARRGLAAWAMAAGADCGVLLAAAAGASAARAVREAVAVASALGWLGAAAVAVGVSTSAVAVGAAAAV